MINRLWVILVVKMFYYLFISDSSQLQDAFSFLMKFLTEIIRHCVSNMEASQAADAVSKQPGANGLLQNGFISSKDNVGHEEEERIMKAKIIKKKLLTQRRRRRRCSTLSDSDEGSSDGQEGLDSDLSEGELDDLLNDTYSDDVESDLSSLSQDDDEDERRKVLVNGRHTKGKPGYSCFVSHCFPLHWMAQLPVTFSEDNFLFYIFIMCVFLFRFTKERSNSSSFLDQSC